MGYCAVKPLIQTEVSPSVMCPVSVVESHTAIVYETMFRCPCSVSWLVFIACGRTRVEDF